MQLYHNQTSYLIHINTVQVRTNDKNVNFMYDRLT